MSSGEGTTGPAPDLDEGAGRSGGPAQHRRRNGWWRNGRSQVLAAVLLGLLGFSLVVQARQTQESGYQSLDQAELVRVLDGINERSDLLDIEARDLQRTQQQLQSGSDRAAAAEKAARSRLEVLGVLAGTVPVQGPGIELAVPDPQGRVGAAVLLDIVQELRDAGAEAIQIGGPTATVRVVAATAFVDAGAGRVAVGGRTLAAPYRFRAIGDPTTMDSALRIPGGVIETLQRVGSRGTVQQSRRLDVDAVVPAAASTTTYATPSS